MRHKVFIGVVGLMAIATSAACEEPEDVPSVPENVAAIGMRLGPDFTGASIRVVGARAPFADSGSTCANAIGNCLNLESDGTTAVVMGLCPSDDAPTGTWSFSYEIFDGPNCTGGSPPNFECPSTLNVTL
ncbi:MAG: hypothetical protein KIS78_26210, partial [Labilithrix sp.]|nr:hypothetical protein [Labilithrix sp.]